MRKLMNKETEKVYEIGHSIWLDRVAKSHSEYRITGYKTYQKDGVTFYWANGYHPADSRGKVNTMRYIGSSKNIEVIA